MDLLTQLAVDYWKNKFKNFFKPEKCNCNVCVNAQNARKAVKK
jgi:hypothetical protein